jgi:hypothetical protein
VDQSYYVVIVNRYKYRYHFPSDAIWLIKSTTYFSIFGFAKFGKEIALSNFAIIIKSLIRDEERNDLAVDPVLCSAANSSENRQLPDIGIYFRPW